MPEDRVLKNYRLPVAMAEAIDRAAGEAGVPATAWVQAAIQAKLEGGGPRRQVPLPSVGARMSREDGLAYSVARAEWFQGLPRSAFRSTMPAARKSG